MRGIAENKETAQRLLLTAEHLFAKRGIDAVSLRAIMAAAGANVASVHYHFGSKEALVEALIKERSARVAARRAELLDALDRSSDLNPRLLAEAFVQPVAEMIDSGGGDWVTFIAGIMGGGHPALSVVTESFGQQARRFTVLMRQMFPDVAQRTIRFRLTQAMSLTFRVLGDVEGAQGMLALSGRKLSAGELLAELTDVVTAILAGPPSWPQRRQDAGV